MIKKSVETLGLHVEEDGAAATIGGNCGNLIVHWPGDVSRGEPLLFVVHMDTVEPSKDIRPVIDQGTIRSSGDTILGADNKSGCAVLLEAVRCLEEERVSGPPVDFVFTVAEETGLMGAKQLDCSRFKAPFGLVLDSTCAVGQAVVQAPTHITFKARCVGKSSHAGIAPEAGRNAIRMAAEGVAAMHLGRIDEDTVANVGKISGGTATNVVPAEVEIDGEARSFIDEKVKAQIAHMEQCLREAAERHGGRLEFQPQLEYITYKIEESAPAVQRVKKAAASLSLETKLLSSGGGSDGNVLNAKGIPSVVLGLGYNNPHSAEENIEIKSLTQARDLVLALIRG